MSDTDSNYPLQTGYRQQFDPNDPNDPITKQRNLQDRIDPGGDLSLPAAPGQFGYKPPPQAQEIPYGFMPMERSRTNPYIPTWQNPSLRDRHSRDWGTPDYVLAGMNGYQGDGFPSGDYVPTERDIPGILHNVIMGMGRYAPPQIGMPYIQGGRFYAAAMAGYQKGQIERANLDRQQALLAMQTGQYRLNEMLRKYSDAYATWGPSDDGKSTGNPERLAERVRQIAQEYGDSNMIGVLDTHDMGAVDRLLKHLDGQGQDGAKALKQIQLDIEREKLKQQQDKTQAQAQARKGWLGTTPTTPSPATPSPTAQPAQESPAPTGVPGAGAPSGASPSGIPDRPIASPRIMDAAQAQQMDAKPEIPKDPVIQDAVGEYKGQLDKYMNDLLNNDSLSGDQVQAAVKAANPRLGRMVQSLLDGTAEAGVVASTKPGMMLAGQIAKRINPDYERRATMLKAQREVQARQAQATPLKADIATQERQRSQIRDYVPKNVRDMAVLQQLADQLKARGMENQIPILNRYYREGLKQFVGDPLLSSYYAQLQIVRADSGRIMSASSSGTGMVSVHTQREAEQLWDSALTSDQLRGVIKTMKRDYGNKLGPITDELNALNGRLATIYGTTAKTLDDTEINRALTADDIRYVNGKPYYKRNGEWFDE